jgi:hypothetical protein
MMKRLSSFRNQGRKEVILGGSKKADANSVVEKTKKQRRANYETQEEAQTNCQKEALDHR